MTSIMEKDVVISTTGMVRSLRIALSYMAGILYSVQQTYVLFSKLGFNLNQCYKWYFTFS